MKIEPLQVERIVPKIILWDIETTHNIIAKFNLREEYINFENILQERYVVTASWKELGKRHVDGVSVLDDPTRYAKTPHDDYHVLKTLHDVLSKADIIVAHNGDAYDIKFTEGRMLKHGFSPLPPIRSIDTLKTAKKRFLFNSNRLDYLGQFLGLGRKKDTPKGLWLKVLKAGPDAPDAIRTMLAYNKQDVRLLEGVFNKLRPYMDDHINGHLFGGKGCPRCGSTHIHMRGFQRSITRAYQRFQCLDCGGWFRDVKATATRAASRIL